MVSGLGWNPALNSEEWGVLSLGDLGEGKRPLSAHTRGDLDADRMLNSPQPGRSARENLRKLLAAQT